MTIGEFSSEFDILYNNIMSNKAPGLDEYEKSVFLTKAQLELVFNSFNAKGNKYQEGVEDSAKRQIEFAEIIAEEGLTDPLSMYGYDLRGLVYELPSDLLFLLNETFSWTVENTVKYYRVTPISFPEYTRLMSKPYKAPLKGQVWRLLRDQGSASGPTVNSIVAEIIPHKSKTEGSDTHYHIRYVRRPTPIILTDLSQMNVTIDGLDVPTECILNPLIHRQILDRAVELAKVAYQGDVQTTVQLNTRNE